MKILMLNHEFPPVGGGASPVTFELCSQLVKLGHKVDVVTMHYKNTARFEVVDGINIYRTPALRKKPDICHPHELATYLPGAFFKTLLLCRKNKYDIIHCHFIIPGGPLAWLVSKLTGIPFIITSHGSDVPGHNPDRFIFLHKIIKPIWKFLVNSANTITVPSNFLAKKINRIDGKAMVTVIPNGIDAERFYPNTEKKKKILLCSRILKFKGFQYFIEAIKDLELDWEIDIIGDGPYLPELKQLAASCKPEINFRGWLDKNGQKYCDLYSQASIFVFPSSAESFGMVVAEAMAAGCAIIASDIPAHREVLGNAGMFVEPCNAQQIKKALLKLVSSKESIKQRSKKAVERVEQFRWKNVITRYMHCYEQVITETKRCS